MYLLFYSILNCPGSDTRNTFYQLEHSLDSFKYMKKIESENVVVVIHVEKLDLVCG